MRMLYPIQDQGNPNPRRVWALCIIKENKQKKKTKKKPPWVLLMWREGVTVYRENQLEGIVVKGSICRNEMVKMANVATFFDLSLRGVTNELALSLRRHGCTYSMEHCLPILQLGNRDSGG